MKHAYFDRFTLQITLDDAKYGSHQGKCDEDIESLASEPYIASQLNGIMPTDLVAELKDYGAWGDEELDDMDSNRLRILWIACGNIVEESKTLRCDQCEALVIQGVFCHETGCIRSNSRFEDGEWIKQRECRECGDIIDANENCCEEEE